MPVHIGLTFCNLHWVIPYDLCKNKCFRGDAREIAACRGPWLLPFPARGGHFWRGSTGRLRRLIGGAMFQQLTDLGFDVAVTNHAGAILTHDFAAEAQALAEGLAGFRVSMAELIGGGGGESGQTQRLRHALNNAQWRKHRPKIKC